MAGRHHQLDGHEFGCTSLGKLPPEPDGERLLPSVAVTLIVLSGGLTLPWVRCSHLLSSCRDETLEMTGLRVA